VGLGWEEGWEREDLEQIWEKQGKLGQIQQEIVREG
jgi:hypothetical protein